jgi:hypothetical protein
MVLVKKGVLDAAYGVGNVCYVELDPAKGFDGNSHKSLFRWITSSRDTLGIDGTVTWDKLLGFAIQRDNDGYYIRFASTLNERPGQYGEDPTFVQRQIAEQAHILGCIPWGIRMVDAPPNPQREPRDLPMQWSRFVEEVLSRDLKLGLISREKIKSRDEEVLTRITRFKGNRSGHNFLDTGVRLV